MSSSGLTRAAASLAFCLAIAAPSFALTPPVLKIADGLGNSVTVDSTGAVVTTGSVANSSPAVTAGSISWSGTVGNFVITTLTGESKPLLPVPTMDIGLGEAIYRPARRAAL